MKDTILDRYVEMYNSGDVRAENYMECANYLQGYRDAIPDPQTRLQFDRAVSVLRGGANLICWLRRTGNGNG